MISAIELERHLFCTGVSYVIINKFFYRYEFCLIVLFIINKDFEISFYYAVLLLSLVISLKVKNSRRFLLNAQEIV